MESRKIRPVVLEIEGMVCENCRSKIEKKLQKADGVKKVKVSFESSRAELEYDETKTSLEKIFALVEDLGYKAYESRGRARKLADTLFYVCVILVLFLVLQRTGVMNLLVPGTMASSNMSYALLFVTGLFTSVHCLAMCGGINLSQSLLAGRKFMSPLLYNAGRVC